MIVRILICNGLTCGQLGAGDIRRAIEKYKDKEGADVELTVHTCCSRCEREEGLCPSVKINDDWIIRATPEKVKKKLREMISDSGK